MLACVPVLCQAYRNHRDILVAQGGAATDERSLLVTLWPLWMGVEQERLAAGSGVSAPTTHFP